MSNERLDAIEARLQRGHERMDAIETKLAENTELTRDIRDVMVAGRVGLKVLGGVGTAAKWITYIVGAAAAIWGFWHGTSK